MGIILGLVAALCFGTADFMARFATRRVGTYNTYFFMQCIGFFFLSIVLVVNGAWRQIDVTHNWQVWIWALVVAILNTGSYLALYRAFEVGQLSIVAPIASGYAAISVLLSILSGERLTATAIGGIVAVIVGVILAVTILPQKEESIPTNSQAHINSTSPITNGQKHTNRRRWPAGISWACLSALGFGITFWLLGFVVEPTLSGLVTTWFIRLVPLCLLGSCSALIHINLKIKSSTTWAIIIGAGILDTVAFLASASGLATGQVAVVSVLSSLYSAVTVILAWIFLKERLRWSQWAGIILILSGIALSTI